MAPIGIAIIGGGIFAQEQHLPAVAKVPDLLTIKAIFSRSLKSAQATADLVKSGKPDLYSTDSDKGYADLLQRSDISAVIIALPITQQPAYIEQALSAGKHVLAEKPIAKDVAAGKKLIDFYKKTTATNGATLAIAENFRFMPGFQYAVEEVAKLGKITHFSVRVLSQMARENKYYNTSWRQKPEYQGGFLLDGGAHHAAATRMFLNGDAAPDTVQAYSALTKDYLPPIDTVNAILRAKNGATGIYQTSAGASLRVSEWDIACENGSVRASPNKVVVQPVGGEESVKEWPSTSGVPEEVKAWGEALQAGKPDPRQSPELALGDVEFLEKIFTSGDKNGQEQKYELQ